MNLSVIIPAHNEEQFIGNCLHSIYESCNYFKINPEIIVVLNRCIDNTKDIAVGLGAKYVEENTRNLAKIRNTGIKRSKGEIVITIDADSIMTKEYVEALINNIKSNKFIGGGTRVDFNRKSLGIKATKMVLDIFAKLSGLVCGSFWFYRKYYEEVGGFNEELHFGEDLDFAKRLKIYGKTIKLKYGIAGKIITSTRKFDKFGDWYFFKLITVKQKEIKDSVSGKDMTFVNNYFYDFNESDKK
jgi:glycosyltransferase involved in cell wall biosynthesis